MFRRYMIRLFGRIAIFLSVLYAYFFQWEMLEGIAEFRIVGKVTPLYVLWIILMAGMILQMLPDPKISMGCGKQFKKNYIPVEECIDEFNLYKDVQKMNVAAWQVLLLWVCLNGVFGILCLLEIAGLKEMIVLSMFYYVSDLICVLFWCPFQSFIMKNRCCVNCRIFNWGHFMMYTPLLFIRSFFTWSLFFTAIIVLIRWEIAYAKYPERFWEGSNQSLQCKNCKDGLCNIKKPLLNSKK